MKLGPRLIDARLRLDLSQEEVASRTKISLHNIQRYEGGGTIGHAHLDLLCETLGMDRDFAYISMGKVPPKKDAAYWRFLEAQARLNYPTEWLDLLDRLMNLPKPRQEEWFQLAKDYLERDDEALRLREKFR